MVSHAHITTGNFILLAWWKGEQKKKLKKEKNV